jgi:IS30 family transposase
MITRRPAVVDQRSCFGDWEIDTAHGRGKSATVTIVERKRGPVRVGKIARVGSSAGRETKRLLTALVKVGAT